MIRRGPSKSVCTVLWDRAADTFHVGQWFRGRIYERRCDLSPDGKYLIYFAMNGKWQSETGGSWTAISHAPYLKAIVLLPKGDCWFGGGLFTDNNHYWINGNHSEEPLRNTGMLNLDTSYKPLATYGGECPSVYFLRLQRDGWRLIEPTDNDRWHSLYLFEKRVTDGWILRKIAHAEIGAPPGKGVYWDEHQLSHPEAKVTIDCPGWEWAEHDRERLVWAAKGQLFAGQLSADGIQGQQLLYDFNPMTFEPLAAPY